MLVGAFRYNAASPVPTPATTSGMPNYFSAGLTQYDLNNFSKNPPHTTSFKTTFRFLFKDSK